VRNTRTAGRQRQNDGAGRRSPTCIRPWIAEITDDAGLSSPNQPASAPTSRPSHPIHRGRTRVVGMATAFDSQELTHGPASPNTSPTDEEGTMRERVAAALQTTSPQRQHRSRIRRRP
jgi:hypothetical protein